MKKVLLFITAASLMAGCVWMFGSGGRKERSPEHGKMRKPERPSEIVYHGNTGSRVFHSPSCKYYHCKTCNDAFRRREDAVAAGYKPCTLCLP